MAKRGNKENDLILFEGTILSYAVHANNARSGIFVETFEVFKQFLSKNVNILVMCDVLMYFSMKKTLRRYFADKDIDVMYYVRWNQSLGGNHPLDIKIRHVIKCMGFAILQVIMLAINRMNGKAKKAHSAKVFFSTGFVPPKSIGQNKAIKKYICIQDAIPMLYGEYFPQMTDSYFWYRLLIEQLNPQDHYFAISQATKDDFCRLIDRLSPEQITVAYLGKNDRYRYIEQFKARITKRYGIRKSDNVVGGGKWKSFYDQLLKEMEQDDLFDQYVKLIGYVDDEDLPYLYSHAMCFVFTSQYEGFGLPVLEAMSCGCPVIASTSSSLPEVVGDAGVMVAWNSAEEHIDAYKRIYADCGLRDRLHEKGLERAKLFSWEKCAEVMLGEMLK